MSNPRLSPVTLWSKLPPEFGVIGWPSSTSTYQRASLNWQLSTPSPDTIVKASGKPVRGPRPIMLMFRHIASATCVDRHSWGRYAARNG